MACLDAEQRILERIDGDEVAELALELARRHGPPGEELEVAEFVEGWMARAGLDPARLAVVPERPNVVARLRGGGGGRSLLFNSHMDSGMGGPWAVWALGSQPPEPVHAEGDRLFGEPVQNDRGPMAAFLCAAKALHHSGVRLRGDLWVTAVVGEIALAAVDEFAGPRYVGEGFGARTLVEHGVVADYALVAETTDFGITWVEAGTAWFELRFHGRHIYAPRSYRTAAPGDHPNAVVQAAAAVGVIEAWGEGYERAHRRIYGPNEVVPKVTVGAIRGGAPYSPARTAGLAAVYVDVRIPPGEDVLAAQEELRQALAAAGLHPEVRLYLFRPGYEAQGAEPLVAAIRRAHKRVAGRPNPEVISAETSMWRDLNVFNQAGVPAACFGPRRVPVDPGDRTGRRYVPRGDLGEIARMYALLAADVCGLG